MKLKLLPLFLALLLLSGCAGKQGERVNHTVAAAEHSSTLFAMDTVMDLRVQGSEELLRQAEQEIYALEKLLSVTDEGSEVYALNRAGEGLLSEPAAALLRGGLALCERTGGALDLTIYPLVRAWGFTTGAYRVPSGEERAALLEKVDYTRVSVDEAGRVTLPPGAELDLGSVAKGWIADRMKALLVSRGGDLRPAEFRRQRPRPREKAGWDCLARRGGGPLRRQRLPGRSGDRGQGRGHLRRLRALF